jgi:hypothetical protein
MASTRSIQESVLLNTSSAADVQCGGGELTVAGLRSVSVKDITSITQTKYRAQVSQVVVVGNDSYTPTASTAYSVQVGDPNRITGGTQSGLYTFTYVTPAVITTIGASAALQREYIHLQLVAKINAATSLVKATAATLTGGAGFSVTDTGVYYPVRTQSGSGVLGQNVVLPKTNADGTGFASTSYSVTTAAVAWFGVGAYLAAMKTTTDGIFGNLISGNLPGAPYPQPLTSAGAVATSGQNYDGFVVSSLSRQALPTISDFYGYVEREQYIFVDNGTGTDTTNLAGFLEFERVMRKHIVATFSQDHNAWVEFFDSPTLFQGAAGAVPATTGQSKIATDYGQWVYNNIGTNTITVPTPGDTGLLLDQDLTATEGAEHTPSLLTVNSQYFVVGKTDFSLVAKFLVADHTDATVIVGFRKKEAHAADFNDYNDLAAIGTLGDLVYTWGILDNAATVATNTTVVPTDDVYEEFVVCVDIEGVVTVKRNNVTYPVYSVGTTPLVLDAGEAMIPTVRAVNVGDGNPDVVINQLIAVASTNWLN